jgi:hypothetical protein
MLKLIGCKWCLLFGAVLSLAIFSLSLMHDPCLVIHCALVV